MDFLWHNVSAQEKEAIKKEAKSILDKFSKSLEKVEKEIKEAKGVQRDRQSREETKAYSDKEFKKLFLKNAPITEDDFVIAEKGAWK